MISGRHKWMYAKYGKRCEKCESRFHEKEGCYYDANGKLISTHNEPTCPDKQPEKLKRTPV